MSNNSSTADETIALSLPSFRSGLIRLDMHENMPIQIYRKFHIQKLKIYR